MQLQEGLYYKLDPDGEGGVESSRFYLMNCLLHSRLDSGNPSNNVRFDEDVNVYLAHLLDTFIDLPNRRVGKFRIVSDHEVHREVSSTNDVRRRYQIYKTQADNILMALGIFENAALGRPSQADVYLASREMSMGRGKAYYRYAQSCSESLSRRRTGLSMVLEKLSSEFEVYVEVLNFLRDRYLHALEHISEGAFYHLERSLGEEVRDRELSRAWDEFLDLYSSYLENPRPDVRRRLEEMCSRIRSVDPSIAIPEEIEALDS
jgi:hypothetical protein